MVAVVTNIRYGQMYNHTNAHHHIPDKHNKKWFYSKVSTPWIELYIDLNPESQTIEDFGRELRLQRADVEHLRRWQWYFLKPMHFIVKQNFYWGLKITSKRAILNVEKCQRLHGCGEWRHWDVEKSGHQGRIVITKFEPLSLFVAIHKKVSVLFWYLSKQVLVSFLISHTSSPFILNPLGPTYKVEPYSAQ